MSHMRITRICGIAAGVAMISGLAIAQGMNFFTIGTGGTSATYYPLGGTIANSISNPPGSRPCNEGGSCGVPGLVAIAQSSQGSLNNINGIQSGLFSSGFVQSDVAYWAYNGTGVYQGKPAYKDLRAIAALYPEHIHLVGRKGANINSIKDLKGKRVSLDEAGSGTYVNAVAILNAFGLEEKDVKAEYVKPGPAADGIKNNHLDAFFITTGYPNSAIIEIASSVGATLVPIAGPEVDAFVKKFGFYSIETIPAGVYQGVPETKTIAVGAQWVTSTKQPDNLIYEITKALWNKNTRFQLDNGHAKGKVVKLETALDGIGIPLHPGAEKFYREVGKIK
jgi:TRAP transporter TAXI family solute receptor